MIKLITTVFYGVFVLFPASLAGQNRMAEHYGYRHLQTLYKGDSIDILIKSKKGDEQKVKPLFLFCQGSLPIPLLIVSEGNAYNVFPFDPDSLSNEYHLVIIGKPYIPLIAARSSLNADFTYNDTTGHFPGKYIERNLLDYYVDRNKVVIRFLRKQHFISADKLIVAGHSEGSTIAAKLATLCPEVTRLIYSGGNPMGRIMTLVERARRAESDTSGTVETEMANWEKVVADPENMDASLGDAAKATYQFSISPIQYLGKLSIPVLVTYGGRDAGAPFNDYWRVEAIRQKKSNYTFRAYAGTEHNYFPVSREGVVNYDIFNWDKVAGDWRRWLLSYP